MFDDICRVQPSTNAHFNDGDVDLLRTKNTKGQARHETEKTRDWTEGGIVADFCRQSILIFQFVESVPDVPKMRQKQRLLDGSAIHSKAFTDIDEVGRSEQARTETPRTEECFGLDASGTLALAAGDVNDFQRVQIHVESTEVVEHDTLHAGLGQFTLQVGTLGDEAPERCVKVTVGERERHSQKIVECGLGCG